MLQMQQLHQEYDIIDMLVWRAYKNIWTSMCAYLVRVGSPRRQSEILGHNAIPQGPGGPTLVWHCTQGFLIAGWGVQEEKVVVLVFVLVLALLRLT